MQKSMILIFPILLWLENVTPTFATTNASQNLHYTEDALIVQKCLTDKVGKDLQKVSNFGSWNNGEEVPCFTRCLSVTKGWFNATESKWISQKIVADLGEDLWMYCKYELERTHDNECEYVHQGFRCLRKAEENTRRTYMTLLNCAIELGSDLNELQKYRNFTEQEQIPCLFKCFAEMTDLYDTDFQWNFLNWTKAFGPFDVEGAALSCRSSEEQKVDNACAWMYREYLCLKRIGANFKLSEVKETTIINTQNKEAATSEVVGEYTNLQDKNSTIETDSTTKTVDQKSFDFQDKNNTKETGTTAMEDARKMSKLLNKNITIENNGTVAAVFQETIELQDKNKTIKTDVTSATVAQAATQFQEKIEIKTEPILSTVARQNIELQNENTTIKIDVTAATIVQEKIDLRDRNKSDITAAQ